MIEGGDSTYLFLPLAHAFAILIQFATFELGAAIAYWSRDPKLIIADIAQVSPSYFPSVPRMFEKIYTLATASIEDKEGLRKTVDVGVKVRLLRDAGEPVPAGAAAGLRRGRGAAVQERPRAVRQQHPRVRDGRRPDRVRDPRVLLRLRRAGDGGLRDDRDLHQRDREPPARGEVPLRLGGQAAGRRRGEDRRRRRGPDQGRRTSSRATTRTRTPPPRRSTTAGCTPATSAASTRTASCSSPVARRTSSSPRAARTSRPPTSRTASSRTAGSRRRW